MASIRSSSAALFMIARSSPYAFEFARGLPPLPSSVSSYQRRTAPLVMSSSRILPNFGTNWCSRVASWLALVVASSGSPLSMRRFAIHFFA